jgi:hypothetical protein
MAWQVYLIFKVPRGLSLENHDFFDIINKRTTVIQSIIGTNIMIGQIMMKLNFNLKI